MKYVVVSDLYSNKSMGCYCGDNFSRGHKYIHKLLSQLYIDFIDNYKASWCKYYNKYKNKHMSGEYDFFIEDMRLIIEVDGGFHRKDNKMNGQSKDESKYIDNIKDELAKENGYKIVRLDYEIGDFKENIIKSPLSKLFNLTKIDWDECEAFSLSNLVKSVCDRWNNKKEFETTKSLAKEFGLSNTTIHSYIKKGVKIGWCKYSAKEENIKNNLKTAERNKVRCSRKVEIFKNGKSKGVFESITSLCNTSQELFGVRLDIGNVSNICRGKGIQSKGFTFKYVD